MKNNRYKRRDNSNTPKSVLEARAKLKARMGGKTRVGGKGSARRKRVSHQQSHGNDDKKLKAGLRKFAVQPFPEIDEVNLFKDDGTVVHFSKPEVLASMPNHLYCIMGTPETKNLTDLMPDILNQLSKEQLEQLKTMPSKTEEGEGDDEAPDLEGGDDEGDDDDSSDEDIPVLEENFEMVADELD